MLQIKAISKIDYASTLVAALSYMMIKQQDAVSLTIYSDKIQKYLPPKSSNAYFQQILKELTILETSSNTNTADSLNKVAEKIKRRGLSNYYF